MMQMLMKVRSQSKKLPCIMEYNLLEIQTVPNFKYGVILPAVTSS